MPHRGLDNILHLDALATTLCCELTSSTLVTVIRARDISFRPFPGQTFSSPSTQLHSQAQFLSYLFIFCLDFLTTIVKITIFFSKATYTNFLTLNSCSFATSSSNKTPTFSYFFCHYISYSQTTHIKLQEAPISSTAFLDHQNSNTSNKTFAMAGRGGYNKNASIVAMGRGGYNKTEVPMGRGGYNKQAIAQGRGGYNKNAQAVMGRGGYN